MKRPSAGGLLRLAFAAVLLGYLLWHSNPREVWEVCRRASLNPLLIAVALVLLDRALMAHRWFVLLRPLEEKNLPPFGVILRVFFVSTFVGTFLPGSVGGDAVRSFGLSRHGVPIADSMASVFVDRMMGVLALLLMAFLGLTLADDLLHDSTILLGLVVTSAACLLAGVLVFSDTADAFAQRLLALLPWERVRRVPGLLLSAVRRYSKHHAVLLNVLAGSLSVQVLRVFQAFYLATAVGIHQPLLTYFAFIPFILIIMLLPITANGIGTAQAAFLWFFGRVGTPPAESFALSVLFVALGIVGNIPGALFYVKGGTRQAAGTVDSITS